MEKRGKHFLIKGLFWVLVFIVINMGFFYYFNHDGLTFGQMTGNSVKQTLYDTFEKLTITQKTILVGQLLLFIIIILSIVIQEMAGNPKKEEISSGDIQSISKKYRTDIDVLYSLLLSKKKIHLSSIAKAFKIEKGTAVEWCKTLESTGLAVVEYPSFGETYIKIPNESKNPIKKGSGENNYGTS